MKIHIKSKIKYFKIILLVLLILLILIIFIERKNIYYKYFYKEYYKVVDRTKKINEAKKNENEKYTVIGWLKIQNIFVDIPIYSISANVDTEKELEGRNFGWTPYEHTSLLNKETIIGHNYLNLSSNPGVKDSNYKGLEDLMSLVYYDVAKESKYIQFTFDGKDHIYKIFSVIFENSDTLILYENNVDTNKKLLQEEIKYYKDNSIYDYNVDVNKNDKILTVSTCTRFFGTKKNKSFSVTARLVRDDEKIDNYSITKNKNYNKIDKKMKGEKANDKDI